MNAPAQGLGLKRRLFALVAAIAVFAALAYYGKNHLSLDELIEQERRVRAAIDQHPWQSFVLGLAIYAGVSLIPGTTGKSIIFSWLFGFFRGLVIIIAGLTAAAIVFFYLSRYIFRDWIEHRYGPFLAALNQHLEKDGAFYLLSLRMAHFPLLFVNLASGASRVSIRTFCWTTALGLLPGTMIFAWIGIRLPSLDKLAKEGVGSLIDAPLIAALGACALFPIVFRFGARKLGILKDIGSESESASNSESKH